MDNRMETQLKTLEEHFEDIRERAEHRFDSRELNVFAEEMERAKTASVEVAKDRLPKLIEDPYKKIVFFPEFYNPAGVDLWLEAKKAGFDNQKLQGLDSICVSGMPNDEYYKFDVDNFDKKYSNKYFGITFRIIGPHPCFISSGHKIVSPADVWGITRVDEKIYSTPRSTPTAYRVGRAESIFREPNEKEREELIRPHLAEYVFGIKSKTDEEILETLLKVHGEWPKQQDKTYLDSFLELFGIPYRPQKPRLVQIESGNFELENANIGNEDQLFFGIKWVKPRDLAYPLPKSVLYLYDDAKESGLFEKLEFGVLSKTLVRKPKPYPDPVLVGTYQGSRIPLCYWK